MLEEVEEEKRGFNKIWDYQKVEKIISQILPATGSGSASTGSSASSCGPRSVIDAASGERATQQGTLTLGSGRGAGSSKSPKKKRRTGFELTGVDAKVKQIKKNYLNSCVNKWRL